MQILCACTKSIQMLLKAKQLSAVGVQRFEDAVSVEKPAIGYWDDGFGFGNDPAVDAEEGVAHEGIDAIRSCEAAR
jgi:hypothetical protein